MNIWSAVVLSEAGEYHGTCVGLSEQDVFDQVRDQFDPEKEFEGENLGWDAFGDFFQFRLYPNPHDVKDPDEFLRLSFVPDAIREHFEGDDPDPTEGLSDDQLREVAETALDSQLLYREFHDALTYGIESLKEG